MDKKTILNNGLLTTIATVLVISGYNQMNVNLLYGIGIMILGGCIYTAIAVLNKMGIEVSGK